MKRILATVLVGLLLVMLTGTAHAGGDNDPNAIVAKAVKAIGGEEKLSKYKAMTWEEKGTYHGMGAALPYTGSYALQYPGQFRMVIQDVFTIVLNGDKGWIKMGGETKELDKEQLAEQKEQNYAGWVTSLAPLKDKAFTLKSTGQVEIDKKPANAILVTSKGHRDVTLYFDTKSGLLVKSQYDVKSPEMDNKLVKQEMFYSGYKEVQGTQFPSKVTIKRDGKLFVEAEMTEVKMLEKLENKVFAMP